MNTKITVEQAFDAIHAAATPVPYNAEWENGTGYLDGIVQGLGEVETELGKIYSSVSPKGRKIIAIPTELGVVAAFVRYTNRQDIIAWHASHAMRRFIDGYADSALDAKDLEFLFGVPGEPTIHQRFQQASEIQRTKLEIAYNFDKQGCFDVGS